MTLRSDPTPRRPRSAAPPSPPRPAPRQHSLEARDDALTFTTAPLTEPLEVGAGDRGRAAATGTDHVDVFARLCDVEERGRSTNVCDGILRWSPAGSAPIRVAVAMGATAYRLLPAHRLRLPLDAGAHPRFARNAGMDEPAGTARRIATTSVGWYPGSALVPTAADR